VFAAAALSAGWLRRAISASPATALVAAGLMVAVGTAVDVATGRRADAPVATGAALPLRPVLALLVLAIAGDIGAGIGTAAAPVAGAAALVRLPAPGSGPEVRRDESAPDWALIYRRYG
jgi:hypothetical protein